MVQWLVAQILNLIWWVVLVDIILGWLISFDIINVRNRLVGTIADALNRFTAPILAPIRKVLPSTGGIDFSPIVLAIGISFLMKFVVPKIPF